MTRLFVVGSGPSLSETPLHLLIGEESWGMGRINKIYDRTEWRPTRIFFSDMLDEQIYPDIMAHLAEDYDVYCTNLVADHLSGEYQPGRYGGHDWSMPTPYMELPDKMHTYDYCQEHSRHQCDRLPGGHPTSWRSDVDDSVYCRYGGTMQVALMHAVEEKFNPIYIVGVDLGFVPSLKHEGLNHFAQDYQVGDIEPFKAEGKNTAYAIAHGQARDYAEERGIFMYNAGIGGQLEAYERVNFESLF